MEEALWLGSGYLTRRGGVQKCRECGIPKNEIRDYAEQLLKL